MTGLKERVFTKGDIIYVLLLAVTMTFVIVIAANGGFAFGDEVSRPLAIAGRV